jgi:hypothetical protein
MVVTYPPVPPVRHGGRAFDGAQSATGATFGYSHASAVVGRKVTVSPHEVRTTIGIVEALGRRLFDGVLPPKF